MQHPASPSEPRQIPFAGWTQQMKQSTLREVPTLLSRPGLLSFALGMPASGFPCAGSRRTWWS